MTSAMMTRIKNLTSAIVLLALTVVAATPAYAQTYSVLSNFGTKSGDALVPETGLIAQGRDGSLYSTANAGGANNWGAVFKVTPAGKEIVLYSFCSVADCADGNSPVGGLTLRPDGHFLGTTTSNGPGVGNGAGTVFDVSQTGTLTTLHTFIGTDGAIPLSAPVLGPDGSFYGVTSTGGNRQSCGTLYKIQGSAFSVLHYFDEANGCSPTGALVLGTDGNLYGTAQYGGSQNDGGVYQVVVRPEKSTIVNWLFTFNGNGGPVGALIEGGDGNFYGTTDGRENGSGSIFRITSTGSLTILHALNGTTDGSDLEAGLVQATNGNFYGVAAEGGAFSAGTLFQVTPAGDFSVLHNFGAPKASSGTVDATPLATPVQNTNGLLYGDSSSGGDGTGCNGEEGCGVFYSWNGGLPAFVSTVPSMGAVGSFVEILGQGFTPTTTVSFNGTPAAATVVLGTYLYATVPAGATTGSITVTTSSGMLTSNKQFIVTQ